MSIQIIVYIIFLSILFIIYFISTLFRKSPLETHNPEWWDIFEKHIKESLNTKKICEYCGEKYKSGEKYCHLCGTGLKELTKE